MTYIADQGEWERCCSSRRMFLALVDSGKRGQLEEVSRGLLRMAAKRLPKSDQAARAQKYWEHGLLDERDQELADRAYLVIRYVSDALDKLPNQGWSGGGEVIVCTAIRVLVPLAPAGFSRVGKLEGSPGVPSSSVRLESIRAVVR